MKRLLIFSFLLALVIPAFSQQVTPETLIKRQKRKGLTIKEWNTASGSKQAFLDHVTTYDSLGRKIEEIEYASYGQKSRVVCEYVDPLDPASKVLREIEYNDRDKVTRIKKYEYNEDGSKKRQLNYYPNGKLESVKEYELIFR
ncbi:MAG: hypothetical protein J6P64_07300 [Bacteroidales bacterium]|jgi:hypothetical protein|nr:hypothetical protein [Bacteroidales bacterium]